jgi:hypothetical protein
MVDIRQRWLPAGQVTQLASALARKDRDLSCSIVVSVVRPDHALDMALQAHLKLVRDYYRAVDAGDLESALGSLMPTASTTDRGLV